MMIWFVISRDGMIRIGVEPDHEGVAPEAAEKYAGKGIQEICRAVGIPPVLHIGSCVDNTRILTACAELVREGGLGDSFDKLPAMGKPLREIGPVPTCVKSRVLRCTV